MPLPPQGVIPVALNSPCLLMGRRTSISISLFSKAVCTRNQTLEVVTRWGREGGAGCQHPRQQT